MVMSNLNRSSKQSKSSTEAGKPAWDWTAPEKDLTLAEKVAAIAEQKIGDAYLITDKVARKEALGVAKEEVVEINS